MVIGTYSIVIYDQNIAPVRQPMAQSARVKCLTFIQQNGGGIRITVKRIHTTGGSRENARPPFSGQGLGKRDTTN
jgi:hypothetical protein